MALESSLLKTVPGLVHGFGTRDEPVPSFIQPEWDSNRPQWKQVHGIGIARVDHSKQQCGEVDALWTPTPGQFVGVQTADCVPILLAAIDGSAAAAVHAGWRGTFARILPELARQLTAEGHNLKNWIAAIGPCIGSCCYEVSEELSESFRQKFDPLKIETRTEKPRHLNLAQINAAELKIMGISTIDILSFCTFCNTIAPMNSYRRDGSGGRQWSVIKLQTNG